AHGGLRSAGAALSGSALLIGLQSRASASRLSDAGGTAAFVRRGDLSPPCAGRVLVLLDECLETLEVALNTATEKPEQIAESLGPRLRRILDLQHDPALPIGDPVERHDAAVRRARVAPPGKALVGDLFGD